MDNINTNQKIALAIVATLSLGFSVGSLAQEPGLLLTNGNILTLDGDNTVVNSVFVRLGRIDSGFGDRLHFAKELASASKWGTRAYAWQHP